MINPTKRDIGRRVVYSGYKREEGVITDFDHRIVYVRFGDQEKSAQAFREELEYLDTEQPQKK